MTCKHWFEGMVARSETMCPFCEIEKLRAELATQLALVEKCMFAMNENADKGEKAEAELAKLKAQPVQEPIAILHDDGYWTRINTPAGRAFADKRPTPTTNVYAAPVQPVQEHEDFLHTVICNAVGIFNTKIFAIDAAVEVQSLLRNALVTYADSKFIKAPVQPAPLTDEATKKLLAESELLDMYEHIGWYSAPRKAFMEKGIQLIRQVEARVRTGGAG